MKVAFFDQTGDVIGGAQESLILLLTHLPADIEPIVVMFNDGAFAARIRQAGLRVEFLEVSTAITSSTRQRVGLRSLFEVPRTLFRIVTLLRRIGATAVHTNTVKAHFLVLPMATALRIPTVAHVRDLLSGRARMALKSVLRLFASKSIAISYTVQQSYGLAPDAVIRNPVNLDLFTILPSKTAARSILGIGAVDEPLFAIVGRVNKWKGHDDFLAAAQRVVSFGGRAHFAIVGEPRFGDDEYLGDLRRIVSENNLEDRIHFIPWQTDMPALYAAIDVLVNCSSKEPFGRTAIEAAAASVPTICYDDAGVADFMAVAGIGGAVKAGDVTALADKMLEYSNSVQIRETTGRIFKQWSASFSAETHAQAVADVIKNVSR